MKYEGLESYCLSKNAAVKDYKEEWQATRFMIRGKMFLMLGGDKQGTPIASLKLEPAYGDFVRHEYKDVIPGYYMNKLHWNSIYMDGEVPDDILRDMIDRSYDLILNSLPKHQRIEIESESLDDSN